MFRNWDGHSLYFPLLDWHLPFSIVGWQCPRPYLSPCPPGGQRLLSGGFSFRGQVASHWLQVWLKYAAPIQLVSPFIHVPIIMILIIPLIASVQYYWTAVLAPPGWGRILSYICGWINCAAVRFLLSSILINDSYSRSAVGSLGSYWRVPCRATGNRVGSY